MAAIQISGYGTPMTPGVTSLGGGEAYLRREPIRLQT